jgi:FAD/FMN-containing dehydrogenase
MTELLTDPGLVEKLAEDFRGELLTPREAGYEEARQVYNGMIDRKPALIARPTGNADVIAAIGFASENGLPVGVRGGGHSVAGNGVSDGGVLLELSSLKGVHVDPKRKTARAAGGALWGEFDRETQVYGLATPGGRVTTTGVGGFTTGGGYGWLSRKFGLTCDNLISADVVTADGRLVTASGMENEDLFWGIRGGSSNFGVVTSFEFQLHEVGPTLYGGLLIHDARQAGEVLRGWRDFAEGSPEDLATGAVLLTLPGEDFIPAELHGRTGLAIFVAWWGGVEEGERAIAPLKQIGSPAVDLVGPNPYTGLQALIDPFAPPGLLNYHRGLHMDVLTDDAIDAYAANKPSEAFGPITQSVLFLHGGAVSRVPAGTTAFGHRQSAYMFHPIACWTDPADTDAHIAWVFEASEAMEPFTTGGVYLNFTGAEGQEKVRAGYDEETFDRLLALKEKYDPTNMFRFNQNIRPGTAA